VVTGKTQKRFLQEYLWLGSEFEADREIVRARLVDLAA
jgi:hypothetical protein